MAPSTLPPRSHSSRLITLFKQIFDLNFNAWSLINLCVDVIATDARGAFIESKRSITELSFYIYHSESHYLFNNSLEIHHYLYLFLSLPGKMYAVIGRRHGKVLSADLTQGSGTFMVRAVIPVIESFNFAQEIRKQTSGLAYPQLMFSHWEVSVPL